MATTAQSNSSGVGKQQPTSTTASNSNVDVDIEDTANLQADSEAITDQNYIDPVIEKRVLRKMDARVPVLLGALCRHFLSLYKTISFFYLFFFGAIRMTTVIYLSIYVFLLGYLFPRTIVNKFV